MELRLPAEVARWVQARPWLAVRAGEPATVRYARSTAPLAVHRIPASLSDSQLSELVEGSRGGADAQLFVSPYLRRSLRDLLERMGVGYLDARGHLHLVAPGVVLHFGEILAGEGSRPRSAAHLGVHGVRAVQALLDTTEPVSLTALAERASLSPAQTHVVLSNLEAQALVRSEGRGPAKRRRVISRTSLLDWLAQQPAARRRERRVDAALYARRPQDLWTTVTAALDRAGIPHAFTGAAAASALGVGPTNVLFSPLRIAPEVPFDQVLSALQAEPTERGANLRLIQDTGKVGVLGAELAGGVRLSPKVRIYLDCLSERRGEDIALQFRETVLGY